MNSLTLKLNIGASVGDSTSFAAKISIGKGGSAKPYPTPVSIPIGITAPAILSAGDYRTGGFRHRSGNRNTHLKKWESRN
ncbi:hypothetical protein [Desulfosporosinus youngiae]|uniref:hypothetical protein n=1 Tax=Desulfosporosinus youngiae TaxID=339862 RepID=UPI0012F51ED0|nr:hypothetical protein [Desulfosporosinus youngiae]